MLISAAAAVLLQYAMQWDIPCTRGSVSSTLPSTGFQPLPRTSSPSFGAIYYLFCVICIPFVRIRCFGNTLIMLNWEWKSAFMIHPNFSKYTGNEQLPVMFIARIEKVISLLYPFKIYHLKSLKITQVYKLFLFHAHLYPVKSGSAGFVLSCF